MGQAEKWVITSLKPGQLLKPCEATYPKTMAVEFQ
jgi:hypothetical protein